MTQIRDFSRLFFILLCAALTSICRLEAYSIASPQRQEIFSANKEFCVVTDPRTQLNKIYRTSDLTTALWEFSLSIWWCEVVVSNDGQTLAVIGSEFVGAEYLKTADCVMFFTSDGNSVSIPFRKVYPNPPLSYWDGPPGQPLRKWYNRVEKHGDQFIIHTTGGGSATFDLNQRKLVTKKFVGIYKPSHIVFACILLLSGLFWRIYHRKKLKKMRIKNKYS